MTVDPSNLVSNKCSLHWLDTENKDRIIFVDQDRTRSVQDKENNGSLSVPTESDVDVNTVKSLSPDRVPSQQETSIKTEPQPDPLGKSAVCRHYYKMHKQKKKK
jgi:hypothetical protein